MKKQLLFLIPCSIYVQGIYADESSTVTTSPYSANLTIASQYISRGFQQTWGKPAVQGGLDYNHSNGFFAGTWASTVSDDFIRDSTVEWDVYSGYRRSFGELTLGTKVAITITLVQKPQQKQHIRDLIMVRSFLKSVMVHSA